MSRSRPNQGKSRPSPVTRKFTWAGGKDGGYFKYWSGNKDTGDIDVENPFTFVLLDERQGITGWNDGIGSGIYSNHIVDQSSEELNVRCGKKSLCKGLYADIKDRVINSGGKFANYLYVAYKEDDEYAIGTVQLTGAALGAWIEFSNSNPTYDGSITCTGFEKGKKGAVSFRTPTFEVTGLSEEGNTTCSNLDAELQDWFDAAPSSNTTDSSADTDAESKTTAKAEDEILF